MRTFLSSNECIQIFKYVRTTFSSHFGVRASNDGSRIFTNERQKVNTLKIKGIQHIVYIHKKKNWRKERRSYHCTEEDYCNCAGDHNCISWLLGVAKSRKLHTRNHASINAMSLLKYKYILSEKAIHMCHTHFRRRADKFKNRPGYKPMPWKQIPALNQPTIS